MYFCHFILKVRFAWSPIIALEYLNGDWEEARCVRNFTREASFRNKK